MVAAVISGIVGTQTGEGLADTFIILGIVLLNAILGVVQESRAEASLAALKQMAAPNAKVIRDGRMDVVPARTLVPGDLVVLETGDFVPADLRLSRGGQSQDTGVGPHRRVGAGGETDRRPGWRRDVPGGIRVNMAYSGSMVTYGRGCGIVTSGPAWRPRWAGSPRCLQEAETPGDPHEEAAGSPWARPWASRPSSSAP